jgi:NAD+ kinase
MLKRILLIINKKKANAESLAADIIGVLQKRGMETQAFYSDSAEAASVGCGNMGKFDIAFSLGGDGTVLLTARAAAPQGIPIIPVNLGTLGFITGVQQGEWEEVFDGWLEGRAALSSRLMLELKVERQGRELFKEYCLNDSVISASGIAKLIRLDLHAEISPGDFTELGRYRSDGLIIATPTGSTAYSMSAGGPILDPEMRALIINPICPFTLSNRALVLSSGEAVAVTVEKEQRSGVLLTVDGQVTKALEGGDRIVFKEADFKAQLISSGRDVYYRSLRTKLNWSGVLGGAENA